MKATPPPAPEPTPADPSPEATPAPATESVPIPAPPTSVDPNTPATWPKWFRVADGLAAFLVVAAAFFAASYIARNSDVWPHLAVGRLLTAGEYAFGTDPFSFVTAGRTWINHAWLADLIGYGIYTADPSGTALVVLKAIAYAAAFGLLLLIRRPGHSLWPWVVFGALGVLAGAPHTGLRPLVFSALFFAATLYILLGMEWKRGSWRNPLLLAGLFWLWANVDAWFIAGPLSVALVLIGDWLHRLILGGANDTPADTDPFHPPAALPDLAKALGVGIIACMLNPHHVQVWQIPQEFGLGLPPAVTASEYLYPLTLSPISNRYTGNPQYGYNVNGLGYVALLGFGAVAILAGFSQLRMSHLLLWMAFAALSLVHYRLILLFAVAAVPIAAGSVNAISTRIRLGPPTKPATRIVLMLSGIARILTVPALLIMIAAAWPGWLHPRSLDPVQTPRVAWGIQPDPGHVRTAQMIQQWRETGRLPSDFRGLTLSLELGNYFAWFAPSEKVFLNSRYEFHGPELEDLLTARRSLRVPQAESDALDFAFIREVAQKHQAAYAIISEGGSATRSIDLAPPLNLVYGSREWLLWHLDGRVAVVGWRGARDTDPAAFDGLIFDPVRLAFGPDQELLPEPQVKPAPAQSGEWWEAFLRVPTPPPVAALDAETWRELANNIRRQNIQYFQMTAVPASMGAAGVLPIALFVATEAMPLPRPSDEALALQLLAVRAARRAISENPDHPDPYFTLAATATNRELALPGQSLQELQILQVAGFRQFLDRIPPPSAVTPQVAGRASQVALALAELYLNPALTADLLPPQGVPMIDLSREAIRLGREYAARVAEAPEFRANPEQRKQYLEDWDRRKTAADDEYAKWNDQFELVSKTKALKPLDQINALIQLRLVGRAIQVFEQSRPEDLGPEALLLAIRIVWLKLRLGRVATTAEDLLILDEKLMESPPGSPTDREIARALRRQLQAVQQDFWRVTGNYSQLRESLVAGAQTQTLTPDERKLVETAVAGGENWRTMFGGVHGAAGGALGTLLSAELTEQGFAPMPLLIWLNELHFYLYMGRISVLEGDIRTARTRFTQALRPQDLEVPAFREERAVAERYLELFDAAEQNKPPTGRP